MTAHPIVFEKSVRSSAWLKLGHFFVSIFVTSIFGIAAWFVGEVFVWVIVSLFLLIGIVIALTTFRQMVTYFGARGDWRVEINSHCLVWKSPVDKLFQSFRVEHDKIESLLFVQSTSGGTKSRTSKREFFIHLRGGQTMQIPSQEGGVWVNDVFEALEQQGTRYERKKMRHKAFSAQKKGFNILPMSSWPY